MEMKLSWARGSETHVCGSAQKGLRKQTLIIRSRKLCGSRISLPNHPRKLKTVVAEAARKTAQVGLEENYIGVFATAQVLYKTLVISYKVFNWI